MSWIDRINNVVFTITTGDGKVFNPLWKSGETVKEFNATVFEFINLEGAKVVRKKAGPRQFPLVFWFTGEDNIEQADAFDQSANDSRAWVVRHPFYGDITGQPLSIKRIDQSYNTTEINVDFWETVTDALPKSTLSLPDQAADKYTMMQRAAPAEYAAKVTLAPADVVQVRSAADNINLVVSKGLNAIHYSEYQLVKNQMFSSINSMISAPVDAIHAIQDVVLFPTRLGYSVSGTLGLLGAVFNSFLNTLTLKPNSNNKAFFEVGGASVLSAMSIAVLNPLPGNYQTRAMVAAAGATLATYYKNYLDTLNDAYVPVTGGNTGFIAGYETQALLQDTIITTISGLTDIAFEAKQERIVTVDKDSNLVILTHKYMGIDADDANLKTFRAINNIKNKLLFRVPKGRQITYYV